MMKPLRLFWSGTSPYVRKVVVLAHETGQADDIELVETDVWNGGQDLLAANPLGKVPALVLHDGRLLADSFAICDYLDQQHGGSPRIPRDGAARWTVLHRHTIAQGVMDAMLARRWELRFRKGPERSDYWLARQQDAIERGLDAWEQDAPALDAPFSLDLITLACALGYFDVRCQALGLDDGWRGTRPKLVRWFDTVRERPSMQASAPTA